MSCPLFVGAAIESSRRGLSSDPTPAAILREPREPVRRADEEPETRVQFSDALQPFPRRKAKARKQAWRRVRYCASLVRVHGPAARVQQVEIVLEVERQTSLIVLTHRPGKRPQRGFGATGVRRG